MADLSQVAEELGVPERLIARSSAARAAAEGVSQDEVLEAWASGAAVEAGAAPSEEAAPPEEEAAAEEAAPPEEALPSAEEEEAEPAPVEVPVPVPAEPTAVPRRPKGPPPLRAPDRSDDHRLVLTGSVALLLLGALMTVLLPAIDLAGESPTALASTWRNYPAMAGGEASEELVEAGLDPRLVADGRRLYLREGCWYCHTQMVRPILTDAGLGPVTRPGDLVYEDTLVLGERRIGPDLMHVGAREPTDAVDWVRTFLADPRSQRRWSTMPGYNHLSEAELTALAHYVVSLKGSLPDEEGEPEGESDTTTTTAPGSTTTSTAGEG